MSFAADRATRLARKTCQFCRGRNVLCFECFRAERERQRERSLEEAQPLRLPYLETGSGSAAPAPSADPASGRRDEAATHLGGVRPRVLSARQIDHRRAMLAHLSHTNRAG